MVCNVSVCAHVCVCAHMCVYVHFRYFVARPLVEKAHRAQKAQFTPQLVQSIWACDREPCEQPPRRDSILS